MRNCLMLVASIWAAFTVQSHAQSFIIEKQFGQATIDTCQSYVIALALAFKQDPVFAMKNWSDLRDFETKLRAEIKKNMGTRTSASGDDSRRAIETVTKGKYTLDLNDTAIDPVTFHKKIVAVTGVSSRSAFDNVPSFLAGFIVKDIIISSAVKIEGKPYGDGHQFAILGVSSPDPNSNTEYLVLNSGARRKTPTEMQIDVCEVGVPDDKSPYFASLGWTKNIDFNAPAGKMRAWRLVKK